MTIFVCVALTLLIAVLGALLHPLWRMHSASHQDTATDAVLSILREQRQELETAFESGEIDAATHARFLDELALRALDESAPPAQPRPLRSQAPCSMRCWATLLHSTPHSVKRHTPSPWCRLQKRSACSKPR